MGTNTTAFQRFLSTGPIAFLPLTPTISSLVWSTKPSLAKILVKAEPLALTRMINAAFRLPHLSMNYLNERILEIPSETPLSESMILDEIKFRESSHGLTESSPLFSSNIPSSIGIPPSGSHLYPPLIHSIQDGTIASFPLRFSHAETYLGEGDLGRTVLIGDAAHTIHPLAGQGLNLGLGDVGALVRCIKNAAIHGGDIGESLLFGIIM
jgi:ubiquinone biosynthesis monooxygenase Coq6